MERYIPTETGKHYLEEKYVNQEVYQKPTGRIREFAIKKNEFKTFLKNDTAANAESAKIIKPNTEPNLSPELSMTQKNIQNSPLNPDQSQPIEQNEQQLPLIPPVRIPPFPKLTVNNPLLRNIGTDGSEGVDSLDRSTQKIFNELDEFDENSLILLKNFLEIEKAVIQCNHLAKLNKVMSSSSLKQLTQIHSDHNNGTISGILHRMFKNPLSKK